MTDPGSILLGDIGGTNARFAVLNRGTIGPVEQIRVAGCSGATEAIRRFLGARAESKPVKQAVLALAGTVENNRCEMTNSGWIVDVPMLQGAFDFGEVRLFNDFEALAWSLPRLEAADLFPLGGGSPLSGAPMLLIGPGTGFGTSCLLTRNGRPVVVASEAGHSTLPVTSRREDEIIEMLRGRYGHVSIERAVSGPGLVNLYEALAAIDGAAVPKRDGASITQAALDDSCNFSRSALDMFCAMLGTVAGNLALTFCARGGVYIAGGIVPRFPEYVARSGFRACFDAGGRYHDYLRDIPVKIIRRPDATFLGLKALIADGSTPSPLPKNSR
ncbi:glucokinase [Bradyrhizobium sp.]|uniref:glucokinase n=1 Tax=Bradyrhizobium sp. TaxID=376 RepID=UPI001D2C34D1|nr:glucokinase [Bradyrhizobium sp.]MBI5322428.1 glucokinase [Bradyrhizobium sp.]